MDDKAQTKGPILNHITSSRSSSSSSPSLATANINVTDETSFGIIISEKGCASQQQQQQTSKRRKKKRSRPKKKRKHSQSFQHTHLLWRQYLQEYRHRILMMYGLKKYTTTSSTSPPTLSSLSDPHSVMIDGVPLPNVTSSSEAAYLLLQQPYLILPAAIKSRDRRIIHSICTDLGLFHCGVTDLVTGDRCMAVSVFHDGLSYVPGIDNDTDENFLSTIPSLHTFKPWIQHKYDTRDKQEVAIKQAKEMIYHLIDQPSTCLRDDVDTINLLQLHNQDLSTITPPQSFDENYLVVDSIETMQRCIYELHQNKPKEFAFDLECFNQSKQQQLTCLIQLATNDGREYVIDVLAPGVWDTIHDGLGPLFQDSSIIKVGHGVTGIDVPSLYRDFGIVILNLFDTLEAAQVLQLPEKRLAKVCEHYGLPNCQVYETLKEEHQMFDWSRRPLNPSMISYGRYDVHYLLRLRILMMRDLILLSVPSTVDQQDASNDRNNHGLQDMIRAFNDENGISDDEYAPLDVVIDPTLDDDDMLEPDATSKTIWSAKDLRMNLELMKVLSASQDKCLVLWKTKPENHRDNIDFGDMLKQAKTEGRDWTASQLNLYDNLAQWREDVAFKEGILSGFVCPTDILAKIAKFRPTTVVGLQQISHHLPPMLTTNGYKYLNQLLILVKQSRDEDELQDELPFPSYTAALERNRVGLLERCIKRLLERGINAIGKGGFQTWMMIAAGSFAVASAALWEMTRRRRIWRWIARPFFLSLLLARYHECHSLSSDQPQQVTRRNFGAAASTVAVGQLVSSSLFKTPSNAAPYVGSLAERLSQKDPALLSNSVFNIPPAAQVYPAFMQGTWNVTLEYGGYLFPSQKISRTTLMEDTQIPGFQKCSIATLCDVGKESVQYTLSINPRTGLEDRAISITSSIDAHLGYPAVQDVLYNHKSNPNRLSVVFYEYRTTNAERIELFFNNRESELIQRIEDSGDQRNLFLCSEFTRQVTFGTGSNFGIPRQVSTNYAHFWTWKETPGDPAELTGNLLTASYLDPSDALFFEEPSKPVAVYSHIITAKRVMR